MKKRCRRPGDGDRGDQRASADFFECGRRKNHHEWAKSESCFVLIMDLTFDANGACGSLVQASATISPTG
jgi:hypothetical protein